MSTIFEIPNLNQRVCRVTVDWYHQMGELGLVKKQTELIRGVVINKMSKSPLHCTLLNSLHDFLGPQLPATHLLRRDDPLTLRDSEPEPDVSIVRGTRKEFLTRHPSTADLVIEVAVTSLADDRDLCSLYAEAGVKEYWIVVANSQQIEAYRAPKDGAYQETRVYSMGDTIECASVPGVKVKLDDLFGFA